MKFWREGFSSWFPAPAGSRVPLLAEAKAGQPSLGVSSLTAPLAGFVLAAGLLFGSAQAETPMDAKSTAHAAVASPSKLIAIARADLGKTGPQMGLPSRLWCGWAMSKWRRSARYMAPASGLAFDHVHYGKRIFHPAVGAILVQGRKGGGHVSIITQVHSNGTVTAISGNDSGRVRERVRSARGIIIVPH